MGKKMCKWESSLGGLVGWVLCIALLSAGCSNEIDREFGPSSLQGTGELPGRVITVSPPTGV